MTPSPTGPNFVRPCTKHTCRHGLRIRALAADHSKQQASPIAAARSTCPGNTPLFCDCRSFEGNVASTRENQPGEPASSESDGAPRCCRPVNTVAPAALGPGKSTLVAGAPVRPAGNSQEGSRLISRQKRVLAGSIPSLLENHQIAVRSLRRPSHATKTSRDARTEIAKKIKIFRRPLLGQVQMFPSSSSDISPTLSATHHQRKGYKHLRRTGIIRVWPEGVNRSADRSLESSRFH